MKLSINYSFNKSIGTLKSVQADLHPESFARFHLGGGGSGDSLSPLDKESLIYNSESTEFVRFSEQEVFKRMSILEDMQNWFSYEFIIFFFSCGLSHKLLFWDMYKLNTEVSWSE